MSKRLKVVGVVSQKDFESGKYRVENGRVFPINNIVKLADYRAKSSK